MIDIKGKYTTAKITIDNFESELVSQVMKLANHTAFTNKSIVLMPDCHVGKGSCVGFTSELDKTTPQIIPNVIGVDIGCGILSVNIGDTLPIPIEEIDIIIQDIIPMGFNVNSKPKTRINKGIYEPLSKKVGADYNRVLLGIGSLGGGNHFCEIGIDSKNNYWITVHTGSRNLGKCICDYHQKKAEKYISDIASVPVEQFKKIYPKEEIEQRIKEFNINKPKVDKELCYIEGIHAHEYIEDMKLAQDYSSLNRKTIIETIITAIPVTVYDSIESIHNFIDFEDNIIRKGAIRSYKGERMIIPFNMKDGILICEGKSNKEWNYSAPHGAGRIMSRSKAKETVTLDEFKKSMNGVYSTCISESTIDESPMAYKDPNMIEEAIKDTCTIIDRIKPILNIKAGGD